MSQTAAPSPFDPNDRKVLVALGNRHVLFGSAATLRGARRLGPTDVKTRFKRVGSEREGVEARIVESLVVDGFEVRVVEDQEFGDVELVTPGGHTTLVDIKAGDRSFAGIDLGRAWAELGRAEDRREMWGFNLERLSLGIIWSERSFGPGFVELPALDVWEFHQDGTIFDRAKVVAEVEQWGRRIDTLYNEVETWAREDGFTVTRDRTVPMSEELMQTFAVPDRDMPILDLVEGETPVMSMVPSGLWLIGMNGLVDVITRRGTFRLAGLPPPSDHPVWTLVDFRKDTRVAWGREPFRSVLGLVSASE